MRQRTVAVFTGSRSEYGLLHPLIRAIHDHPELSCRLLVAGTHLHEGYGATGSEIERDGFEVLARIPVSASGRSLASSAEAAGRLIVALSPVLAGLAPDFLLLHGDRTETLAAAVAASQLGIPLAHVEGGDITEGGAFDDSARHAITKLAHLHFTTNQDSFRRVLALGEEPWRVFMTGLPALDCVAAGDFVPPPQARLELGLEPGQPLVLFTQHALPAEADSAVAQFEPSLEALKRLACEGCRVVLTYPNNDAGGERIIERIEDEAARGGLEGFLVRKSLGRRLYHGALNLCGREGRGVCAGNSSSGVKETPAFGCPAVDIGPRQAGRLRAANVLCSGYVTQEILAACRKALFDEVFRLACADVENPYGSGDAGRAVAAILADVELGPRLIMKKMTV